MKGYKVASIGHLELVEMPSEVGEAQVKVKVNKAGLSREDVSQLSKKQSSQYIISRQCVGMVVEAGSNVHTVERGNRVLISPYIPCNHCVECKEGNFALCFDLKVAGKNIDGYLRDFVVTEASNLYLLPENVSDNQAVFVEHTARALAIMSKLNIQKGNHVVIVGASIVGLILAQLAIYYQAIPILVDGRQSHLDMANKLGIYYTINYVSVDPYKKIEAITGGRLSENLVLLGSGNFSLFNSTRFLMSGGCVVVADVEIYKDNDSSAVQAIAEKQLSLYGINNGLKYFMPAINLLANKTILVAQFVSKEIKFDQVEQNMQYMSSNPYEHVKVIVSSN
ncbi:MAG: alcohol dehydrogenase catalytic domain-containing protein [Firmicutes bacterium]|nr:alcohol dehydrogenase catalytic domain-containing protein [Bacillota bacterium]MCL1953994.1 alcohol dehydrogenase catalytic domain-containing protein [Bacillota bacterium]